jgi:hypothetical protein
MLRQKVSTAARFYVSKLSGLHRVSLEELPDILAENPYLLNQIVRQGVELHGTRPFWYKRSLGLAALARFSALKAAPVFITWSAADMQWDDLHNHMPRSAEWRTGNDSTRLAVAWDHVQNYPHMVAAYIDLRFRAYLRSVLAPSLKYSDCWWRYEWQARGTGHIHGLFFLDHALSLDPKTNIERNAFAQFWAGYISAWNPNPNRPPDARNPASVPRSQLTNTVDEYTALLNRLQIHSRCTESYCLRAEKGKPGAEKTCRFFFPRLLFNNAVLTKDIKAGRWL